MGFRIYAKPNPQPIEFIKDGVWDDVVKELLGEKYDYHNVWFNMGEKDKLSTEGVQFLLDELVKVELTTVRENSKKYNKDQFNIVLIFLKQTIEHNNYLISY